MFDDIKLEKAWRPQNYSEKFFGPTRLREGIVRSMNLVSIRVLRQIGIDAGREHMLKFGFQADDIPRNLSIALGSPNVTPMSMARAYSVFANGGYLIDPYIIQTISNQDGKIIYQHEKIVLCDDCEGKLAQIADQEIAKQKEVEKEIEAQFNIQADTLEIENTNSQDEAENAQDMAQETTQESTQEIIEQTTSYPDRVLPAANQFITESFMKDVIKRGTGRKALVLNRSDLAGKTGTTNDQVDAWFNGFQRNIVTHAWVGFDSPEPMGRAETGGAAALPIWIDYMRVALEGIDEYNRPIPPGVIAAKINSVTGDLASANSLATLLEYFTIGNLPKEERNGLENIDFNSVVDDVDDDLF